jgi:hypothetical protein
MLKNRDKKLLVIPVAIGIILCLLPYLLLFPSTHDAVFDVVSSDSINTLINAIPAIGALIIGATFSFYYLGDKKLFVRILAIFLIAFVILKISLLVLSVFNILTTSPIGPF